MAKPNFYKLSVLEDLPDGTSGFVVKMTAIPTRREAELIANMGFKNGLITRYSKHINPKKEYFYGK